MSDFSSWYRGILDADCVPRWALSIDAAREIFEAMAPEPKPSPPKQPRIPCWITRNAGVETLSTGRVGSRMIHGIASTPTISNNGNAYKIEGCKIKLPVPLLSAHHKHGRIGECTFIRKASTQLYIRAIFDDTRAAEYAWEMVQSGDLCGLSIGSRSSDVAVVDDGYRKVNFFDEWVLKEVSLCRSPSNPDCFCEPFDYRKDG